MRIMHVVEWQYRAVWEFSAAFLEPKEAQAYALQLHDEFPADDIRIVTRKVAVDEDVVEVVPMPEATP